MLQVIYLVFNEGYSASSGSSLTRPELSGEAIRLGRLLVELLPEPEVMGLLALMLLHESRRAARATLQDELVLLEDQDRSLWNQEQITEGGPSSSVPCVRGDSVPTPCKRQLLRCMPKLPRPRNRLGADRRTV